MEPSEPILPSLLERASAIQSAELSDSDKAQLLYDLLEKGIRLGKRTEMDLVVGKKKTQNLSRDIENLYNEVSREKQAHGKLESYCRDLQKEKKALAEEAKRMLEEEEKKRNDLSKKVQDTLDEIQRKIDESSAERVQLAQEKEELTAKMNELLAFNDQKDKDFQAAMKLKEDAANDERAHMQERITQMLQGAAAGPEQQLRSQLNEYKQKFESFQQSLVQNNESFVQFKKDLQATQKKIQVREKENNDLKKKLKQSETYTAQMMEEIAKIETDNATLAKQKEVLAGLRAQISAKLAS